MALRPRCQLGDGVRQHRHIIIHHPEPFGAKLVRLLHACGEAAGTAEILGLRRVHHTGLPTVAVDDGLAPTARDFRFEFLDHALGFVGMLVVDHDDAPRGLFERKNRVEQCGQKILALVGGDDHGELVDRRRLRMSAGFSRIPLQNVPIRHRAHCPTTSRQGPALCMVVHRGLTGGAPVCGMEG